MPEIRGLEKQVLMSSTWRRLTQRVTLPWVLRSAGLPHGTRALEVGSGGGFNAEVFLERFGGWRLTASDYDPDMVALASRRLERFGDRVDVRQADATALPFESASFDVAVSIFVWHHVGDWTAATHEAARVLAPDGRLLLVDLTAAFFRGPIAKLFPPVTTYHAREVPPVLGKAGFSRWKLDTIGPLLFRAIAER